MCNLNIQKREDIPTKIIPLICENRQLADDFFHWYYSLPKISVTSFLLWIINSVPSLFVDILEMKCLVFWTSLPKAWLYFKHLIYLYLKKVLMSSKRVNGLNLIKLYCFFFFFSSYLGFLHSIFSTLFKNIFIVLEHLLMSH